MQRGYDMLAQAISGYMSITGFPDEPADPVRPVDLRLLRGHAVRVQHRLRAALPHRTGQGQRIDLALLDSLVVALDNLGERYTVGGEILTRAGNVSFAGSSTGVYRRRDGHVAVVGRGEQRGLAPLLRRSSAATS